MSKDNLIDYAYPMMMVERRLREAHDALLERNYNIGLDRLLECVVEAKIAANSVRHMKEQQDALRQQTKAV